MLEKNVIIKCNNVSKIYDIGEVSFYALNDVSFQIYEGEFLVILGPSGSGKSTLLNIIGGMDSLTSGEFFYKDMMLHTGDRNMLTEYRKNKIGFVFQSYNLMSNLTALENVELAKEIKGDGLDSMELLRLVKMDEKAESFPSQLSGGQQQRIAVARALVKSPEIILCDEPTGALDSASSREVLELLVNLVDKYNKTVVVITHNENIAHIADRVMTLRDGKIESIKVNEEKKLLKEIKI